MAFTQFQYCSLCRINHRKKRKHIYSIRHQNIVKNMLDKYLKKITMATSTINTPVVKNSQFERGAKFWCHFCVCEHFKHLELDSCTVAHGGIMEHIGSDEHKKKMWNFFYENKVDESQRHPEQFHLKTETLKRFKENAAISIKKYEKEVQERLLQSTRKIRSQELQRIQILSQSSQVQSEPTASCSTYTQQTSAHGTFAIEKKATLTARGEGLTFIGAHNYGVNEGNIFTGATPPWMTSDTDKSEPGGVIGPTMETYTAHLEMKRKKKLPAGRVGAQFDHEKSRDEQWLPSFGRVWSKGRRLQSKHYFQKKYGMTTESIKPSSEENTPASIPQNGMNEFSNSESFSEHSYQINERQSTSIDSLSTVNGLQSNNTSLHESTQNVALETCYPTTSVNPLFPRTIKPYVKKRRVDTGNTLNQLMMPVLPTPILDQNTVMSRPSSTTSSLSPTSF